jgi:hypothetical protein
MPARKGFTTVLKRCQKTQQWIIHLQAQKYTVVIPTKYKDLHGWADCVDRFIWVVKQTNKTHIVPVGAIIGPAHLLKEIAALCGIRSVRHVNNHVDLETY